MSRRKISKRKVLRFIVLILFSTFIIIYITNHFNNKEKPKNNKQEKEVKEEIKDKELSLIMVGDNLIHDKIYNYAKTENTYDFTDILSYIKPIVSKYDLAYYNQETILGGSEIGVSSYPAFNSPYEVGDAMIDAGFNLVSLATNHTLDRGKKAIVNSRNYWNSKENVLAVGSYTSYEERAAVHINEVNDITYTLLNYTYGTNGIPVPNNEEYLVNIWPATGNNPDNDAKYQAYKKQIKEDIDNVRDKVDVLMVAMHWGIEYEHNPNNYQKDMAQFLSDNGVDIIIGTHPHVVQPVTYIDDTLVIYSLGNFMSAHEVVNMANRVGLMTSLKIIKDKESNIKITDLNNELLYMYYTSGYKSFKVIPFSSLTEEYLPNYKEVYSKYKDIVTSLDDSITVN